MGMQRGSDRINPPGKRSKKEAIKDNWAKVFWSELIRQQGEVSSQQVKEDVTKGHVIVGLHCEGGADPTLIWHIFINKTNWILTAIMEQMSK